MTGPSPFPLPAAAMAAAGAAIAAEFREWAVSLTPDGLGMWGAYWQSDDGRHRRYIVEPSAPELLVTLRACAAENNAPAAATP
jgi:hypothetical protein